MKNIKLYTANLYRFISYAVFIDLLGIHKVRFINWVYGSIDFISSFGIRQDFINFLFLFLLRNLPNLFGSSINLIFKWLFNETSTMIMIGLAIWPTMIDITIQAIMIGFTIEALLQLILRFQYKKIKLSDQLSFTFILVWFRWTWSLIMLVLGWWMWNKFVYLVLWGLWWVFTHLDHFEWTEV